MSVQVSLNQFLFDELAIDPNPPIYRFSTNKTFVKASTILQKKLCILFHHILSKQ